MIKLSWEDRIMIGPSFSSKRCLIVIWRVLLPPICLIHLLIYFVLWVPSNLSTAGLFQLNFGTKLRKSVAKILMNPLPCVPCGILWKYIQWFKVPDNNLFTDIERFPIHVFSMNVNSHDNHFLKTISLSNSAFNFAYRTRGTKKSSGMYDGTTS